MATIRGKTAAKIDELANASVVSGALSSAGNLTLTTGGGTVINAGSVGSSIVSASIDSSGNLIFTRRDGTTLNVGSIGRILDSWPVGSIYASVDSTSPATIFGGTWVRYAKGRVLVGVDDTAPFNAVESTGGEQTHALTAAESGLRDHGHSASSDSQGTHNHGVYKATGASGSQSGININTNTTLSQWGGIIDNAGAHGHNITVAGSGAADATSAHNNLQPYITVYMWKRTA